MKKLISILCLVGLVASPCLGQKTGAANAFQPAPITCNQPYVSSVKTGIERLFTGLIYGTATYSNNTIIVCDGNSITAAASGEATDGPNSYPRQLAALTSFANTTVYNYGVGGQNTDAMAADAAAQIDTLCVAGKKCILIAWELTNQITITGDSASAAYTKFANYCAARRAAGWTVIAVGTLPRSISNCSVTSVDVPLQAADALLLADWRNIADAVVFPRSDSRLATVASACGTYLPDGIHPDASTFTNIIVPMFRQALLDLNCH